IGNTFGKVRAMFDDRSKAVEEAPPSTPVEVLGLEGLPQSGDVLMVADREKARQIAEYREQRAREATLAKSSKLSLEGLADQIKKAMLGLLDPVIKETYQGRAEVRDTFRVPKAGTIAGCYVLDGIIKRDSDVRLVRDGVQVYKGKVGSLKRFKDDASEVRNGMECGINLQNFNDVKKGDVIEAFVTERIAAEMGVA